MTKPARVPEGWPPQGGEDLPAGCIQAFAFVRQYEDGKLDVRPRPSGGWDVTYTEGNLSIDVSRDFVIFLGGWVCSRLRIEWEAERDAKLDQDDDRGRD